MSFLEAIQSFLAREYFLFEGGAWIIALAIAAVAWVGRKEHKGGA